MPRPLIAIICGSMRRRGAPYAGSPLSYSRAVLDAGGLPVLIPPLGSASLVPRALAGVQGLLLAGGGDIAPRHYACRAPEMVRHVDEDRDITELAACRVALDADVPVLGICRGIQVLAVAAGGELVEDIPSQVVGALNHSASPPQPRNYPSHSVAIVDGSHLGTALGFGSAGGSVAVNSMHHQAPRGPAGGLRIVAQSPDGIVEGLESATGHALGVQWHPEELVPGHQPSAALFAHLVRLCQG